MPSKKPCHKIPLLPSQVEADNKRLREEAKVRKAARAKAKFIRIRGTGRGGLSPAEAEEDKQAARDAAALVAYRKALDKLQVLIHHYAHMLHPMLSHVSPDFLLICRMHSLAAPRRVPSCMLSEIFTCTDFQIQTSRRSTCGARASTLTTRPLRQATIPH